MSKYDRLGNHLREQGMNQISMTFAEVERVVGTKLPKSQKHQAWWSNSTSNNVMTKVWLNAGYETAQVDVVGQKLVFRRIADSPPHGGGGGGMSEGAREFIPAKAPGEVRQNRHPALGALKGTFTIEPGYDLTSPVYTDEEWAEVEKEMEEDWDQIEQGMSGGKT